MKLRVTVYLFLVAVFGSFRVASAQQPSAVPRVGFIFSSGAPGESTPWFEAFQHTLHDAGYVEGKTVSIERRYTEGRLDRTPTIVNELVQQKVDVIVAPSNVAIRAAREATRTIPIVMISSVDPVAAGYVESFARPGGNITGIAWLLRDVSAKRVELLKDLLPKFSRLGILWDADGPGPKIAAKEYEVAARGFKLELRSFPVRGSNDFPGAFRTAKAAHLDALIVVANPLMRQYAKEVFDLALKHRIPSISEEGQYVIAGSLISYGANLEDLFRRAAAYVVEILKGAKPGDLAVKLPEKFEIFINLKTAQQLGIVIPQHVLIQADRVIK
jgi:putative ABC transport system substrate-binding protein